MTISVLVRVCPSSAKDPIALALFPTIIQAMLKRMKMTEITDPLKEGISEAYENVQDRVSQKTRELANTTDEWVHDNPWKVIAIVAVTSLVLGVLLGGRRGDRDER